jgi:hypothetical protein
MKAKLIFNLDDPDDSHSFKQCAKASDMAFVLWELCSNSKKKIEWEISEKNIDNYETLDLVFERFHDLLDEHHIIIDELVI